MELSPKNNGSFPNRGVHQILPICNNAVDSTRFLVQTKTKTLNVLKANGNQLEEVSTKSIPDLDKVIGIVKGSDAAASASGLSSTDVLIYARRSEGIEFYKVDAESSAIQTLGLDDKFSDDRAWEDQLILGGQFLNDDPEIITILGKVDERVVVYRLQQLSFKRVYLKLPDAFENPSHLWVTKSGYASSVGDKKFHSDWISTMKDGNILSYKLSYDFNSKQTTAKEVIRLKLPNDLKDSVKNIQFLPSMDGKPTEFQDLVVSFQKDVSIIYGFEREEGGTAVFQLRTYFYGSNSALSSSCNQEQVFSVSDGPTIKPFKGMALSDVPLKWTGDLMNSTFVFNDNKNSVWLIGNSVESDDLIWYNTELKKLPEPPVVPPTPPLGPGQGFPEISLSEINKIKLKNRMELSILDGINSNVFAEAVNMQNGGIGFDLKLIPEIGFGIQYASTQVGFEGLPTVGNDGWSTSNSNFISMDPKSDTLDAEPTYFLVIDGAVYNLEFVEGDEENKRLYKVSNSQLTEKETENIRVLYEPRLLKWTVDTKTSQLMFGSQETAIKWNWSYRSFEQTEENSMKKIGTEWYLTRFVKKQYNKDLKSSLVLLYDYQQIKEVTDNETPFMRKEYTKSVQLVRVRSEDSDEVLINFQYDKDQKLQSYDAQTGFHKQNVQLLYNKYNVLQEIQQKFLQKGWETMIKFTYGNTKKVSKVEVPQRNLVVNYHHERLNFLNLEGDVITRMQDAPANTVATAAHSSSMSAFATSNRIVVFNPADGRTDDLSGLGKPMTEDLKKLNLVINKNCVIRQATVSHGDYITVFCFDATKKEEKTKDKKDDKKWQLGTDEYFQKGIDTKVTPSGNLVTVDAQGKLEIFEWVFKDSKFNSVFTYNIPSTDKQTGDIQATDTIISWYNEQNSKIFWIVKTFKSWSATPYSYEIKKTGEYCSTFFKNNFDLGPKMEEYFETTFASMKFQMRGNAMSVATCSIDNDGWTSKKHVHMLVLNRKGEKAYTKDFEVRLENLGDLRKSVTNTDEGKTQTLNFRYVKEEGKFLIEASDPEHPKETKAVTEAFREAMKERDSRMFIFEPKNYMGYFLSQTVFQVGSTNHIKHNGSGWVLDTTYDPEAPYDMKLGKEFLLKRAETKGKIKVFGRKDMKEYYTLSNDSNKVYPFYPGFVASLEGNNTMVVSFKRNALGEEITEFSQIQNEIVHGGLSSSQFVVTTLPDSPNDFKIRLSGWLSNSGQETYVVKSVQMEGKDLKRTVSYDYDKQRMTQSRQVSFGQASLIKGGEKSKFGHIAYSFDINETYPKAYDGNGTFLEELTPGASKSERKPQPFPKTMVFDKWDMKPITNFSPFEAEDCQVGFIGFEEYEKSSVPPCSWKFEPKSIVLSSMALTGNSFLRLDEAKDVISVEFPLIKDQSYTISTWVRIKNKEATPPKTSTILQAKLQPEGVTLVSKVVYIEGDWQHLEIKIHPNELQPLIEKLLRKGLPKGGLKLLVEVKGGFNNGPVDVDHVIFSPTAWTSEIFVYDDKGEVTHNLLGNTGLIVTKIYDALGGNAVTKTNGLGQVTRMQFETVEENLSSSFKSLKSLVQIESLAQPGWIQGFQNDPLATFEPKDSSISVFRNGFRFLDFSRESVLTLDMNKHESFVFRFSYSLIPENDKGSEIKLTLSNREYILKSESEIETKLTSSSFKNQDFRLQSAGSIVFGLYKSRIIIWTPEGLVWEDNNVSILQTGKILVAVKGNVIMENVVVLPNPSLKISYFNTQMEEIQILNMVDESTVKVYENYYDPAGRLQAKTKETLINVNSNENLLQFRPNFVDKIDVENQKLEGEASRLNPNDGGVPFTSVVYESGPLESWSKEGLPGTAYSISGSFGVKYSAEIDIHVSNLFPKSDGHQFKNKVNREGYTEIVVTDKDSRLVANAVITPGSKNLLATYNYDEKGRLVASLPPQYHEQENTFFKLRPWKEIGYSKDTAFGTFYEYDDKDNVILKSDPDVGTFEYVFNEKTGNADFALHKGSRKEKSYDSVFYYIYDGDLLTQIGELTGFDSNLTIDDLKNGSLKLTKKPIKIIEHLGRRYDPLTYTQRITSKQRDNDNMDFIQELGHELPHGRLSSDTYILPSEKEKPALLIPTKYKMSPDGEKLLLTGYAVDEIAIGYSYNLLGQVSDVYFVKDNFVPVAIARYEYAANGHIKKETLLDINTGNTQLMSLVQTIVQFNSPGYPVKYSNDYFTQEINYDDNGYGDVATGEPGYPTSTSFENTWSKNIARLSPQDFISKSLNKNEAEVCYNAIQKLGYLNDQGKIVKLFRPLREVENLPVICSVPNSEMFAVFSKMFMERMNHGYKFQYGNMKELIKVKFIDLINDLDTPCASPLTPESLQLKLNASKDTTEKLWGQLLENHFLFEDKEKGKTHIIQGKSDNPVWNREELLKDLESEVGSRSSRFAYTIAESFGKRIGSKFSLEEFSRRFDIWKLGLPNFSTTAPKVYQLLETKGYLSNNVVQNKILDDKFTGILKSLGLDISKAFSVLGSYFSCEIGKSPLDMELFDMDFNGNPKVFYSGFERYELSYHPNTNKISVKEETFGDGKMKIGHDSFGNLNLIQDRDNKTVLSIDYDKVSSRPLKMKLGDGREIFFRYDYKGERVSKQLYNKDGKLQQEIKYLGRDSMGRVLVEKELTYISESLPPRTKTTTFFYGPRGLFAFMRNGKYFNVLLDNIGSTRLVLRNGQVVASYNYLPYGKLISKYIGPDPDGDIRYRFTGQEFDEETGLYNFHVRIYDPSIGRFYQIDPEEVFFSPYKYVGNAPIIFIDPDGREPITIILAITLAIVGAYLGAAAANKTWDFTKWDFTDYMTWVGIGLGALGGALLPTGIGASFTALLPVVGGSSILAGGMVIALGTGAAYLSMASAMNDWDPTKWDYTSPELYNAAFSGFGTGAGFAGGAAGMKSMFVSFTKTWHKVAWISSSIVLSVGFGYYSISAGNDNEFRFWKWDFTRPGTYNGIAGALLSGAIKPDSANSFKNFVKDAIKVGKSGMKAFTFKILVQLKRAKSFDLVKAAASGPATAGQITGIRFRVLETDFTQASSAFRAVGKEDLDSLIFGTVSDFLKMVKQGIGKDLSVSTSFASSSAKLSLKMDIWMEHVAVKAFKRLRRSILGADFMNENAVLVNNGSMLALTGLSGFLIDGPVILLGKEENPHIFNRMETKMISVDHKVPHFKNTTLGDLHAAPLDTQLNKLAVLRSNNLKTTRNELVQGDTLESDNFCEDLGKYSTFDENKNSPFMGMLHRGSNYMCPTEIDTPLVRTVMTQTHWKSQIDANSVCQSKNPLPSFTSEPIRFPRSVGNESITHGIHSSRWISDDSTLPPSASSGSKPTGIINVGVKVLTRLWNGLFKSQQKAVKTDHTTSWEKTREPGHFHGTKHQGKQDTSAWKECVPWVHSEDGYVDGFTCFSSSGIVQVTPKPQADIDQGAIMTTNSQDTYSNCNFWKGHGMGSAYCEGHKSNMRYISFLDERPFDRVNDNLLLMAVILHCYQALKCDNETEDASDKIPIEAKKIQEWRQELLSLQLGLEQLIGQTGDKFYQEWAMNLLEDRVMELEQFEKYGAASQDSIEEFEDNLSALRDEICEGFLLSGYVQ